MVNKRIIIAAFTMSVLIAACGAGGSAPAPPLANQKAAYDVSYEDTAAEPEEAAEESVDQSAVSERMIIRNAYLEMEAEDSAVLYKSAIDRTKALGGYEASYNIDNYETYSVINAQLRVPADKYDELIGFISASGNVVNSSMRTEDITEDYLDVKIRLNTKRAALETYYRLLEKANSVEEIIQLQQTIDGITVEIESMEGRLRFWNEQTSMSTIDLLIRQYNDPVKIRKDIRWNTLSLDDMGYLIKQGFATTLDYIAVIAQWLVIAAISLSPLLAIIAVVYFILRKKGVKLKLPEKKERKERAVKKKRMDKKGVDNKAADNSIMDNEEKTDF